MAYVSYHSYKRITIIGIGLADVKSMIAVRSNYGVLTESLTMCDACLSAQQKGKLRKVSYVVVAIMVIDAALRMRARAYAIPHLVDQNQWGVVIRILTNFQSEYISSLTMMMFMYFCYMYGELMISSVRDTSKTTLSLSELEMALHRVTSLIKYFGDKMSVVAAIKFAYTFATSLAFFVDYYSSWMKTRSLFVAVTIYDMVFNLLCLIVLCAVIDHQNRSIMAEYRHQYKIILGREGVSLRAEYVQSRKEQYELTFSACGMFDLNKKCLLSYISSLITFTILFMQLNRVM
ncbi:hypothetical protein HDE_06728 [Halotydeus destructor]|nr:hypothetical protein HDE_06728 [Halotydeus destructor]